MIYKRHYLFFICLFSCYVGATQPAEERCAASYQLEVVTSTQFNFGSGSLSRQKFDASLSLIRLNTDADIPEATWWGVQLSDVKMQGNGTSMAAPPELSIPFALLKHDNGKIIDFRFSPQPDESIQQQLKGLAFYLQFPNMAFWPSATEQRKEADTIGEYSAQYQAVNKTTEPLLPYQKTRLRYHSGENMKITGDNPIQTIDVDNSVQNIALNSCWFKTVQGRENMTFHGVEDSFSMVMQQTYSIDTLLDLATVSLWSMPDTVTEWQFPQFEPVTLSAVELAALEQRFIKALGETDLMAMRGSELAQWLLQFDQAIAVLREELISTRFDEKQKMRLFNALGHLDSENGNQLLVTLINDNEFTETDRFRAIRAITTGTSPLSVALKTQLSALLSNDEFLGSDSLYGATLMTLGAVIQRREANELSRELFTEMTHRLTNSEDEQQQSALVAGLGNSQMPEAVPTLKDHAQSSSARVRANVAASLGQIGDAAAQQELQNMLQRESNDKVQQSVLGAIGQFKLDNNDLQKISTIAQNSKSERTRSNAIKALANQTHKNQQVQQQLKQLMRTETSRRNFALAAKSIEALKQQTDDN